MTNLNTVPTVRVVSPASPGGFKIINESDLTPEHEIWSKQSAKVISLGHQRVKDRTDKC